MFVIQSDRVTRLLGLAVPIYFAVMTSMHHEVHSVVVSELELREQNEEASASLRQANVRLEKQAMRDTLTGLPNRAAFGEQLERAVSAAARQTMVGVLYFDLDHFKFVNDSLGHRAGDALLVEVAHRVQSVMRSHDMLARLGGDEFTMLLDRLHDGAEAVMIADRVAEAFAAPFEISGRRFNASASIGIATNLNPDDDAEVLLSNAARRSTGPSRAGGTASRSSTSSSARRSSAGSRRAGAARRDRERRHRRVVPTGSGAAHRAHRRRRGARSLETRRRNQGSADVRTPRRRRRTRLRDRCRGRAQAVEARAGLAATGITDDFRIWCNVSANQLTRARPTERLAGLLERTGCDPNLIGIEITETAILPDVDAAAARSPPRKLGIKVALDDFGTGHSSLTLLRGLPIDKVKIDQTFVRELTRDARVVAIVRSVINLASRPRPRCRRRRRRDRRAGPTAR